MALFNTAGQFNPRRLDEILLKEMRGLGNDAELAFASHARHGETGNMARNVKAHTRGRTIDVTVYARNPKSGFDYVAVTRFGHRVDFIEPRADRRAASVTGRRASLRFVIGGRVVFAKRVKAFKPDHDWAEDAMPDVKRSAERAMRRIGQRIVLEGF